MKKMYLELGFSDEGFNKRLSAIRENCKTLQESLSDMKYYLSNLDIVEERKEVGKRSYVQFTLEHNDSDILTTIEEIQTATDALYDKGKYLSWIWADSFTLKEKPSADDATEG